MGRDLYHSSKEARALLDLVDDSLSFPLSNLMFEGPAEELEKSVNAQPAIMAVSLACLRAVEGLDPGFKDHALVFAGHSLGEYTALVASGALDTGDGIRLVRERGRLMQETSDLQPSGMAAILGLDEAAVKEVCGEAGVQIANINADGQIVISGDKEALARAISLASARGARRCLPLKVAGAFHSQLMSPAQEGLNRVLSATAFKDPVAPVVANCTAKPLTTAQEIREELEVQLCNCVQWKKSVECMLDMGVSTFVEFGPGKVLTNLAKRVSPEVKTLSVSDMTSAKEGAHQAGSARIL